MERMIFLVQGSEPDPYQVTLEKNGINLNAYCTCAAGSNGMYCKHRFRIISGSTEGVISPDVEAIKRAVDWVVNTDIERALRNLALAEDRFNSAKKDVSDAKRALAAAFHK